ncbi:response regulator transcription factor [Pelagibacterium lacus]|uniref:DNA-binding response regulator n=1 Tax=Pelagibacterium lacus TaxID=2282655 RepID=A0A369W4I3_9HYPH|nr:LuxR C-terminal-related transcriptional regulator [Pelagibacterium lacus]RDE08917.1 DNA-binding response regulator [Pelagibacterium lacus]
MNSEVSYRLFFNRDRLVHIVDGDMPTCESLEGAFRAEGFQTAILTERDAFVARLNQRRPDVVVLNSRLDGEDMLPALKGIKEMRAGIPVFMMTESPDIDGTVEAMRLGASDVFVKPVDSERVVRAVREVLRRDVHFTPGPEGMGDVEIRGFGQLTPREREVLQLIANGQSNKEAGRELGISPRTIEVHRARVMEKLGARNTADLIRIILTS